MGLPISVTKLSKSFPGSRRLKIGPRNQLLRNQAPRSPHWHTEQVHLTHRIQPPDTLVRTRRGPQDTGQARPFLLLNRQKLLGNNKRRSPVQQNSDRCSLASKKSMMKAVVAHFWTPCVQPKMC